MKNIPVFILFLFALKANAQITFQKAYGNVSIDGSWCVQQTSDGGYIITAEGSGKLYNIKTDPFGVVQWSKACSTPTGSAYGNFILKPISGGYITTGISNYTGTSSADVYVVRQDNGGNLIWSKTYGGSNIEEGYSIQQTADTGYIIAGYTNSYGAGSADIYVIKTDSSGNAQWKKTYGGPNNEGIQGFGNISIHKIPSGGYIINGYTNSFGAGNYDLYVIKIDNNGNVVWSRTFGGSNIEYGYGNSVGETSDGKFIIVGTTQSFGSGMLDVFLVKLSSTGNLQWSRTYGGAGDDYGYSVHQIKGGGYVITGATNSFGSGGFDVYMIRTDIVGNVVGSKTFGGAGNDYGYSVQQTSDSGFVITGYTDSYGSGMSDVYLIKTDVAGNSGCNQTSPVTIVTNPPTIVNSPSTTVSTGLITNSPLANISNSGNQTPICLTTGLQEQVQKDEVLVSPNPFSYETTLRSADRFSNASFAVFNSIGLLVKQTESISGQYYTLRRDDLPAGVYFVRVTENGKLIATVKLVIKD